MKNIYLIDDNATKHSFLGEVLDQLNESLTDDEEPFVDGFNGKSLEALVDADLLTRAAQDSNGLCLVDLEIKHPIDNEINQNYETTAKKILENLREAGRIPELQRFNELKSIMTSIAGKDEHFMLSSAILVMCESAKTKSLIISTNLGGAVIDSLKREGFTHELFPYSEESKSLAANIVRVIKTQWFNNEWLSFDVFIKKLEVMTHSQIDVEGLANDYLRRFLKLTKKEFLDAFGNPLAEKLTENRAVKSDITEALKNISGVFGDDGTYTGREAALDGAWLLALGVYRELFPSNDWKTIFKPSELSLQGSENDLHGSLHPPQKDVHLRRRTLKFYVEMCERLFKNRKSEIETSTLEKVELTPYSLSFTLDFPAKRLQERISYEARSSLGDKFETGHNSSEAIWRFWMSSSFSDSPNELTGVFGVHPRINVYERGNKTEIKFQ